MKKVINFCLIAILIFASAGFGVKLYNSRFNSASFLQENQTTSPPPSSYDLRDYIDIKVENQHSYGICYAFASLTSLETYLALNYNEYYDFSEVHFATSLCLQDNYYSSLNQALTYGGNFNHFYLYTQKDKSLVLEEELPISSTLNTSTVINTFNNINNNFYPIVKVNDTKSFPQYVGNKSQYSSTELEKFRTEVKQHIMQYGSLSAGIYTDTISFTASTVNYRITNNSLVANQSVINENINHLISIVGWDDNYNANGQWSNPGAYICLNSWGTNFGKNGYFYVSYDDYFIESTIAGVVDATLSTTNNKISSISINQDQTAIFTHAYSETYPTIYTANIFDTSNYIGESITHIDSFIKGGATKFYIKFFDTYKKVEAGINSSTTSISTSYVDEYSLYHKYKLSSPVKITKNYMLVVREVKETQRLHSLGGDTADRLNISPSYFTEQGLRSFDIDEDLWDPEVSGRSLDMTLPLILHTNAQYIKVSPFESNVDSIINNNYIKNNATFQNKQIKLKLTNANITDEDVNNIKITKLYKNRFNDITSNFNIVLNNDNKSISITMINDFNSSFTTGNYLISIPLNNITIYRVIELQKAVGYTISYELGGGTANNPTIYTSKHTSLNLNTPVKKGYTFEDWYTDSGFVNKFNPKNLPYTNLTLYAKYDFASPSIISKSKDITITYYKDLSVSIHISANHVFESDKNTLSYQWYTRNNLTSNFNIVDNATLPTLTLNNVNQSGYYACAVSINITDESLVSTPVTKTLEPNTENSILVNIKPYIYDMSQVVWNYSEPISYDTKTHTVHLLNLPQNVTAVYSNNSSSEIGTYNAVATLDYDEMNGNAIISGLDMSLVWEIRKSKITITVENITSTTPLTAETLNSMYSCKIEHEYLPESVVSYDDKLNYLNLAYTLQATSQPCVYIISVNHNTFDIHDITINSGKYRIVVYSLTDNNIKTSSKIGFVQNCVFSANETTASGQLIDILNEKHLDVIKSYNINYSYLKDDKATVFIPLEKDLLFNNLSVYTFLDNQIKKVNASFNSKGVKFATNQQYGTYIIVKQDYSHNTNSQIIVLVIIIAIYIALGIYALISGFLHKHKYKY